MQAVLMAGGKGTRLRPFTHVLPKPLVPIGDRAILERVLEQLAICGFSEVVIAVGYKRELIMAVIGDGSRFGLSVRYHVEDKPLSTIGALASIEGLDEHFLVMNGDICTDLHFGEFLADHVASGARASIGTYARRERIELGVLELDGDAVVGFTEKPTYDFTVSIGVNAFDRSILELVPPDTFFGFDDLMHRMLEEGVSIRSQRYEGLWQDIGRLDDYERMSEMLRDDPELLRPRSAR